MSEYENVFRRRELHDMFVAGEVKPLEDLYLVEDAALTIQKFSKQLDFYAGYKKKKTQDINDAIKVLTNKVDFFKAVIASTLKDVGQKSVKFPGSCVVSSRNAKAKWKINDEEEFIAILQAAQKSGEDVDNALEKVIQFNVRKREASKLLDIWESSGKLEGFLKMAKDGAKDVVTKEAPKTTIALKFFEEEEVEGDAEDMLAGVAPVKVADGIPTKSEYDALNEIG